MHFILHRTSGQRSRCWPGWAQAGSGAHFGIGWLRYADPFAAVVVSLMILRMTLHLGREAVGVLMDEIPRRDAAAAGARSGAG